MLILGETKTNISRREISRFQKIVKRGVQLENISLTKLVQKPGNRLKLLDLIVNHMRKYY